MTVDVRNRGIQILLAVAVLVVVTIGGMFYRANFTCGGLRDGLRDAQALRADGDFSPADQRKVGEEARQARSHGCNVDDLVDPAVGQ